MKRGIAYPLVIAGFILAAPVIVAVLAVIGIVSVACDLWFLAGRLRRGNGRNK